jgi:cobalt-zinc-cadmium resistance protein CzcA
LLTQQVKTVEISKQIKALEIKRDLQAAYYALWYYQSKQMLWRRLDSIYSSLSKAATLRVKTGESAGLDSISAQAKSRETFVQLQLLSKDIEAEQETIRRAVNSDTAYLASNILLTKLSPVYADTSFVSHPLSIFATTKYFYCKC